MRPDELRQLVADATPGPWRYIEGHGIHAGKHNVVVNPPAWAPADARLTALAPTLATDLADALEALAGVIHYDNQRILLGLRPHPTPCSICNLVTRLQESGND